MSSKGGRVSEDSGDQIVTCSDLTKPKLDLHLYFSERGQNEETKIDDKRKSETKMKDQTEKRRSLMEGLGNLTSLRKVRYYAKLQHQQQRSESVAKSNHGDAPTSSKDSTPMSRTPLKRNRCESLSFSKLSSDCIPVGYINFQMPTQTIKERNRRSSSFSYSALPQKESEVHEEAGDLENTKHRFEELENTWNAKKEQSPATSKYAEQRYQKFKNALSKMHTHSTSPEPPILAARLKPETSKINLSKEPKRKEDKCKNQNPIFAKYLITSEMFRVPSTKKQREDTSLNKDDTDQNYSSNRSDQKGLTISPPHKTLLYHNRSGARANSNVSPSFKNIGKLKSSNSMAEIMLKARNINESLKQEHRKISNHYSSCQDLSYKCEQEDEAEKVESGKQVRNIGAKGVQKTTSKMTAESVTFKKLIKEIHSGRSSQQLRGEDRVPQTARSSVKQEDDSPKECRPYSEKKHMRGNSQTQQKDWNKVRVDIQLNDFQPKAPSAQISSAVTPSKTSKLASPRTKLGREQKGKFKFPQLETKKSLTRSPKKSSCKLPSKVLKLEEKKEICEKPGNKIQKSGKKIQKPLKKTKNGDYTYGEQKKNFPFNPIYTPSVKLPTNLPRVKNSEDEAALSSERRPLLHNDIPIQSISPSKKIQPKHEPSLPELPKSESTYRLDELRGLPSSRRAKNETNRQKTMLKSDYVSLGMQRVCQRELESYESRKHELGPLRESEEEERIYRKVKRMQEVARQLYNS